MYDVEFEYAPLGETTQYLRMCYETGYLIKTIDGLTGTNAEWSSWQDNDGYGDILSMPSQKEALIRYPSKLITIKGRVLDKQTDLKQRMLSFFVPGRTITMYINTHRFGSKTERYRKASLIIKQAPVIAQTKHSEFLITAMMPLPFFAGIKTETISFLPLNDGQDITLKGDVSPEFRFTIKVLSGKLYAAYLSVENKVISLKFDNTRWEYLTTNESVTIWRENGRLKTEIQKVDNEGYTGVYHEYFDFIKNGTLTRLPAGKGYYVFTVLNSSSGQTSDAQFSKCELTYSPLYSGVLVDGV